MQAQSFNNETAPEPDQSMLQAALIEGRTYPEKFEVCHPEMSTWKGQRKEAEIGPWQEGTQCFYRQE